MEQVITDKKQEKGLVIVYTGEGKGKTTAALGLALRAAGYHKKILIIQFGKNSFSGELKSVKKLKPYIKIIQGGKGFVKILGDILPFSEHQKAAEKTLAKLSTEINSNKWDIVIADEILGAVASKLINLNEVLKMIRSKPEDLDLILTGHNASPEIIAEANLVTAMKMIKHPFEKGILAKEGIDY